MIARKQILWIWVAFQLLSAHFLRVVERRWSLRMVLVLILRKSSVRIHGGGSMLPSLTTGFNSWDPHDGGREPTPKSDSPTSTRVALVTPPPNTHTKMDKCNLLNVIIFTSPVVFINLYLF